MAFSGKIEDAFRLQDKGVVLMLTDVEGSPEEGLILELQNRLVKVLAVGKNSTDGKPVSTRNCLTGQPTAPYGSVLVDWECENLSDLKGEIVAERTSQDV